MGQLNSNFLRMGEPRFFQMVLGTWPRLPSRSYMVNPLKSPEPEGRWPFDLVCSIMNVGPIKFVQMIILGWPWPTYRHGRISFLMYLNGIFWKVYFLNTVEAKVIILTWNLKSNQKMSINKLQRSMLAFQPRSLILETIYLLVSACFGQIS